MLTTIHILVLGAQKWAIPTDANKAPGDICLITIKKEGRKLKIIRYCELYYLLLVSCTDNGPPLAVTEMLLLCILILVSFQIFFISFYVF
jgi:hypothetical protein